MHLGVIPDGHRRYADENDISPRRAYLQSQRQLDDLVDRFTDTTDVLGTGVDVDMLTVYAFSEENLKRDDDELTVFFDALCEYLDHLLPNRNASVDWDVDGFQRDDVDIHIVSTRPTGVPSRVWERAEKVESMYDGDDVQLNVLLSYNGRREIAQAARDANASSVAGIASELEIKREIDYVIRTGDNPRRECLSGFPIWQAAYAEFYHLETNFPATEVDDVRRALQHYKRLRKRRGK